MSDRGIKLLKNQKGELSSNYWEFRQAVVAGVAMDDEDTMTFAIEARGATVRVRGPVTRTIKNGVIGNFKGTFPAADSDTQELELEEFEVNVGGGEVKP